MSIFAAHSVPSRTEDMWLVIVVLAISYFLIYPAYVFYRRFRQASTIKKSIVTSAYKQPQDLSPSEVSYLFDPKIASRHMYACLLELANRSILHLHKKKDVIVVEMGPKVVKNLKPFEKFMVGQVHAASRTLPVDQLMQGYTKYKLSNGEVVDGSKQYVFWWLVRQSLRDQKIIKQQMSTVYVRMILMFSVVSSLFLSVVPLFVLRFVQMTRDGEVEVDVLMDSVVSGLFVWLIALLPMLVIGFLLLRFRGHMVGRTWLVSQNNLRYIDQAVSFREFTRMTHSFDLKFESKELESESLVETRPFAIAFGYIKEI